MCELKAPLPSPEGSSYLKVTILSRSIVLDVNFILPKCNCSFVEIKLFELLSYSLVCLLEAFVT